MADLIVSFYKAMVASGAHPIILLLLLITYIYYKKYVEIKLTNINTKMEQIFINYVARNDLIVLHQEIYKTIRDEFEKIKTDINNPIHNTNMTANKLEVYMSTIDKIMKNQDIILGNVSESKELLVDIIERIKQIRHDISNVVVILNDMIYYLETDNKPLDKNKHMLDKLYQYRKTLNKQAMDVDKFISNLTNGSRLNDYLTDNE